MVCLLLPKGFIPTSTTIDLIRRNYFLKVHLVRIILAVRYVKQQWIGIYMNSFICHEFGGELEPEHFVNANRTGDHAKNPLVFCCEADVERV